jgi:hypothetical protein
VTDLLINVPNPSDTSTGTLFGGLPTIPRGTPFTWPVCSECEGPLQYLGRIAIPAQEKRPARFALLFMCNNDPGMCEEWDADAGGNAVLVVPGKDAAPVKSAPAETAVRQTLYGATIAPVSQPNYNLAREEWAEANSKTPRQVLGQMYGQPVWIQSEFTPTCSTCDEPMQFVAQLESGPDADTEINFGGGGCAYVYECNCGSNVGKMHWQCG